MSSIVWTPYENSSALDSRAVDEARKVARIFTRFRYAHTWRYRPQTKCQRLEVVREAKQVRHKPINDCRHKIINSTAAVHLALVPESIGCGSL